MLQPRFVNARRGVGAATHSGRRFVAGARNYRHRCRSKLTSCEAPRDPESRQRWVTDHDGW